MEFGSAMRAAWALKFKIEKEEESRRRRNEIVMLERGAILMSVYLKVAERRTLEK